VTEGSAHLARIVEQAEAVLTRACAGPVRLGEPQLLAGNLWRSTVVRCSIEDGPAGAPKSVILKVSRGTDPLPEGNTETAEAAHRRFITEMAAARFLNSLEVSPHIGPRLYGVDPDGELLVFEDLGSGASLADRLTGDDPVRAADGLDAYARTLGRLHAATAGAEERYAAFRREAGGGPLKAWAGIGSWRTDDLPRFVETCGVLGVAVDSAFEREVDVVGRALEEPGPFLAFTIGDACPDNHIIEGDEVRLFDYEFSGFGNALLDAAYLRLPFPSCWCMGRLPPAVRSRAEQVYRRELMHGCPVAADDRLFAETMLCASAYWTIRSVGWTVQRVLDHDEEWGLATHRQRHVYRLEMLAQQTRDAGFLEAIGEVVGAAARVLRKWWAGDDLEMAVYPAFRSGRRLK
jgi:hypothetical protein